MRWPAGIRAGTKADAMALNVDFTAAKRGELLTMLQAIEQKLHAIKMPPA